MANEPARWSPEQLEEYMRRFPRPANYPAAIVPAKPSRPRPERGVMNKTEMQYAAILDAQIKIGQVTAYHFESVTLLLEPKNGKIAAVRYTPDFSVSLPSGKVRMVEIKAGRARKSGRIAAYFADGAREKLLWAAKTFPEYEWVLSWLFKGKWEHEVIK